MSENSRIEWTDHTFNPWIGCTKVSPGCANCYAETQDKFRSWTPEGWGAGKPRKRTSAANWKGPIKWNREAGELAKLQAGSVHGVHRRPRVFCASLADWLDDEVPIQWLADLMRLIAETPNLDWLLLTKRPQNFRARIHAAFMETACGSMDADNMMSEWEDGTPPENVWMGTTAEDQRRADERIPKLLEIPAAVRFLSVEPMLEPINMEKAIAHPLWGWNLSDGIHWVICGGESGPGFRPFNPEWARSLRDQCQAAGVPFFMKQMGGLRKPFPPIPDDLYIREFPRVGRGIA